MITQTLAQRTLARRTFAGRALKAGNQTGAVVRRDFMALRTTNALAFLTGFVEPVLFLLAFGYGVGGLIGTVEVNGEPIPYAAYIAPALLASSAMNGAIFDSTFNVFFKMHFMRIYEAMMSTSLSAFEVALGQIAWAMLRGGAYAVGFLVVVGLFGLITTPWALLAIPAAVLVAFAFASIGMAITSYMKTFQHLNWVTFALLPMFLFSGTFYPITVYPEWLQAIIVALPLWQAIAMTRGIMLGQLDWALLGHTAYFVVLVGLGLLFTTRRLEALFLR
jgi:lipooligosaccharide transport system permease protein